MKANIYTSLETAGAQLFAVKQLFDFLTSPVLEAIYYLVFPVCVFIESVFSLEAVWNPPEIRS